MPDAEPPDTDELVVKPIRKFHLSKKAAGELFKLLNAIPLKDGEGVSLVEYPEDAGTYAIMPNGVIWTLI